MIIPTSLHTKEIMKHILEKVAKIANIKTIAWNDGHEPYSSGQGFILDNERIWNPLLSNDDAFSLAAKLKIETYYREDLVMVWSIHCGCFEEKIGLSLEKTLRELIVKAASNWELSDEVTK